MYSGFSQNVYYGEILCGTSSDRKGCGDKSICRLYKDEKKALEEELRGKITERDNAIKNIMPLENQAKNEVPIVHFDYLTRAKNLELLMQENSHVWWTVYMLMIAFVLLDNLLVILKATIPMGAYEYKKDAILKEFKLIQNSNIEVKKVYADTIYADAHLKMLSEEAKLKSVSRMINMVNKYYSYLEQQEEIFYKNIKRNIVSSLVNKILRKESHEFEENKIKKIKELFDKARENSINELFKSIE